MPSRVHWAYITAVDNPRFDASARVSYQDLVRRKGSAQLDAASYARFIRRIEGLPIPFRKAIPMLQEIATEYGIDLKSVRIKKFRLPKHLRKNKNPMCMTRNAA